MRFDSLGNICTTVTDYVANGSFKALKENVSHKNSQDGYAVLIRLADYRNKFKGPFEYIDRHSYNFLSKTKLYGDEIIISNVGAHLGTVFRTPLLEIPMSLGPNAILLKTNYIDDYYYYFLTSKKGQALLKTIVSGSAQPKFNKTDLKKLIVPVPSLDEQNKISQKLLTIDKKIQLNEQINANLVELAQSIYQRVLSTFPTTEIKLKDFTTITMGQSPSSKTYNEDNIGMPLLNGAADFRDGIHPSKWTTDPKRIAQKGSYIFGVRATIGLTKKIFRSYAIGRGTGTATPKDINNDEILYFVLKDMFKKFEQTGSGSVYINISKKDFQNYFFNVPNTKGLLLFHKKAQPIMNHVYKNERENKTLQEVKECLLDKLF